MTQGQKVAIGFNVFAAAFCALIGAADLSTGRREWAFVQFALAILNVLLGINVARSGYR